ncbi:PREDICTED: uncharacterized protein LOC106293973 isoform X2 [Brassica oleracea var. oleracea]|uniref:uncharacterized protein LOC106293973 isoform X2 n=1 Tax=Brassica oleracea var. oleracea TaxID=109376 RepID=UPI0006A6B37E|nr:PREDICTED: uncharacterized protein LOC106293973 isoform X2 [Brassica oleracea var. oleracea]
MRMILLPSDKGEVYIRGKKRAGLTSDEEVSGLCIGLVLLPSSGHWNLEDGTNSVAMAKESKNVHLRITTDVLLELFLFTTSADCRLFRGNALVSEMQGLIFGDVFLTVVVSSHLSCGQLPLLQRFQRS